jgi:hypothetical protein
MTEQHYLILHKVRGQPAFDIAILSDVKVRVDGVHEQWWIVATSGHRAYPYWYAPISLTPEAILVDGFAIAAFPPSMPEYLADHYAANEKPAAIPSKKVAAELSFLEALIGKPKGPPVEDIQL